jgi:hypothetical protein
MVMLCNSGVCPSQRRYLAAKTTSGLRMKAGNRQKLVNGVAYMKNVSGTPTGNRNIAIDW